MPTTLWMSAGTRKLSVTASPSARVTAPVNPPHRDSDAIGALDWGRGLMSVSPIGSKPKRITPRRRWREDDHRREGEILEPHPPSARTAGSARPARMKSGRPPNARAGPRPRAIQIGPCLRRQGPGPIRSASARLRPQRSRPRPRCSVPPRYRRGKASATEIDTCASVCRAKSAMIQTTRPAPPASPSPRPPPPPPQPSQQRKMRELFFEKARIPDAEHHETGEQAEQSDGRRVASGGSRPR